MSDRQIRELQQQVAELQRQVRARPAVVSGVHRGAIRCTMVGGNKIAEYGSGPTDVVGIKTTTNITAINAAELTGSAPNTTDPDGYQDGLAWATIQATGEAVFVAYRANGIREFLGPNLAAGTPFWVRRSVGVTGPSSVIYPVWLIWGF